MSKAPTNQSMEKSVEEINPSILVESLEKKTILENEETESLSSEMNEDEPEPHSSDWKMTFNPSMLNITGQYLQPDRRPSTASRFSWGGVSAFSGNIHGTNIGNNFLFVFVILIAFILGLMVEVFSIYLSQ